VVALMVQGVIGFCLAIQPADGDIGTIGRKYAHSCLWKMPLVIKSSACSLEALYLNGTLCREFHDGISGGL